MAIFDRRSRYAKSSPIRVRDARGREQLALPIPDAPPVSVAGSHERKQGERLDHIAAALLQDANGFWRIADVNDAMTADALAENTTLKIPRR